MLFDKQEVPRIYILSKAFVQISHVLLLGIANNSANNASHFKAFTLISHINFSNLGGDPFTLQWYKRQYYSFRLCSSVIYLGELQEDHSNRILPIDRTSFFCVQSLYETPAYLFCHLALNMKLNCNDRESIVFLLCYALLRSSWVTSDQNHLNKQR